MAWYTRKYVVEHHDDPRINLPRLSTSLLIRLEQRGVYKSKRYSGPNSPAQLDDDDIRKIHEHIESAA